MMYSYEIPDQHLNNLTGDRDMDLLIRRANQMSGHKYYVMKTQRKIRGGWWPKFEDVWSLCKLIEPEGDLNEYLHFGCVEATEVGVKSFLYGVINGVKDSTNQIDSSVPVRASGVFSVTTTRDPDKHIQLTKKYRTITHSQHIVIPKGSTVVLYLDRTVINDSWKGMVNMEDQLSECLSNFGLEDTTLSMSQQRFLIVTSVNRSDNEVYISHDNILCHGNSNDLGLVDFPGHVTKIPAWS